MDHSKSPSQDRRDKGKITIITMDEMRAIIVFFTLITFGQAFATQEHCLFDADTDNPADYIHTYDPQSQLCCNGEVENIRNDVRRDCCGGQFHTLTYTQSCCGNHGNSQVYDPTTSICCGETVHDKGTGECCFNTWINTATHTCCHGRPRLGVGGCCGSDKVVNPKTHLCCTNSSSHSELVPYSRQAMESGQERHFACCGLQSFNRLDQECCNGHVHSKVPFKQCCGSNYIDSRTHICCRDESLIRQDGSTECCASTPFNPSTQTCSNGNLYAIANGQRCPTSTHEVISPTLSSCCELNYGYEAAYQIPTIPNIQDCCLLESYLKTNQMCCNGYVYNRTAGAVEECCGSGLIDTAHQLCCGGRPLQKLSDTHMCCGHDTYDSRYQTCCSGRVSNVINGQCCGHTAYEPTQSTCCSWKSQSRQHNGSGLDDRCCGTELLDDNQLCVYSPDLRFPQRVVKQNPDHDGWCSRNTPEGLQVVTFDTSEKVCSSNGVPTFLYPVEEVCGGRIFDTRRQICCDGFVHAKTIDGAEQECCDSGTNSYNPETQSCIANVVSDLADVPKQCGQTTYNSLTHVCWGGKCSREKGLMERYPKLCGESALCYREENWYHPDEKQCCSNTLYGAGEACCNGRVQSTPGTELGEGACCNGMGYNPNIHMCCGGELYNITNNEGLACCGDRAYNTRESQQICCDDNLWSTDGNKTVCTDGVAHGPGETLCGDNVMAADQICCQGTPYPKDEGTACCGNMAFDSNDATNLCCANTSLYTDAQGKQCCNDIAIDPATTQCCLQGGLEIGYSLALAESSCCQEGSYDDTQHTCCDGVLHFGIANGQCCGVGVVRNPAKEVCCGGRVQQLVNDNSICCKGGIVDGSRFSCCGESPLNKHHSVDRCCNNTAVYNVYDEVCNSGIISSRHPDIPVGTTAPPQMSFSPTLDSVTAHPPPASIISLCGNTRYNQTTSECCNNSWILNTTSNLKCCNNVVYNSRKMSCFNGKVKPIRNGRPCDINGDGQITDKFVCCNGTFHRIQRGRNQCCGNGTFNPNKEQCCGGEIINMDEEDCCGGKRYEIGNFVCCVDEIFDLSELQSVATAHCCPDGEVLDKKSGRCYPKDCKICNERHSKKYWRKKLCHKQYLLLATLSSVKHKHKTGKIILEASRMTQLDRGNAQWQDEVKSIKIVIDAKCNCEWIVKMIERLENKGKEKDFLIMTDVAVNGAGRLVLSYDDYILEANPEMFGKVFMRMVRRCDR